MAAAWLSKVQKGHTVDKATLSLFFSSLFFLSGQFYTPYVSKCWILQIRSYLQRINYNTEIITNIENVKLCKSKNALKLSITRVCRIDWMGASIALEWPRAKVFRPWWRVEPHSEQFSVEICKLMIYIFHNLSQETKFISCVSKNLKFFNSRWKLLKMNSSVNICYGVAFHTRKYLFLRQFSHKCLQH